MRWRELPELIVLISVVLILLLAIVQAMHMLGVLGNSPPLEGITHA